MGRARRGSSSFARSLTTASPRRAGAVVAGLALTAAAVELAARLDALSLLLTAMSTGIAVVAALRWTSLLLYAYAVWGPFNFAGPQGPVARLLGIVFVVGYLLAAANPAGRPSSRR